MVSASEQGTWVRGVLLRFWRASLPVHFRKVQHDRGPTGSLELHGRKGAGKIPNIPEKLWLEKRWGLGEKGRLGIG